MYPDYEEHLYQLKSEQEREFSQLNLERLELKDKMERLDKKIASMGENLEYTINQINNHHKYNTYD